jgi:hypothetical protein
MASSSTRKALVIGLEELDYPYPVEVLAVANDLQPLVPAVKAATRVERVYYLALMERAAHFHLWLVPKKNEYELRGVEYLAQQPPLTPRSAMQKRCRRRSDPSPPTQPPRSVLGIPE